MITDIDRIVKFFLHIFHLQSGVSADIEAAGEYRLVSTDSDAVGIYELRVKQLTTWKTRRMSIRMIGDSVESKSSCYVVTYDDLLVIKIPPYPLSDFNKYLENIHIELGIARRLSSLVHCLIPTLSSILQKVPELSAKIPEDTSDIEAAYVEMLTKEPRYHGYLKIGDRFAFFMSLSKHPFFNQVIEKIHGNKLWIQEEIFKNSRVFENSEAFESVYSSQKIHLYERVHEMIKDFSRKADALLTLYGGNPPVADYQKKEWLFAALAKMPFRFETDELPSEFCDDLRNLLEAVIYENQEWVDDYQKTVRAYIRKKNFDKNRTRIEALMMNILNLIYRLKQSNIAIRDLKPDNILVRSNESDVYANLSDPDKYDFGLIDLETAVDFQRIDSQEIRQPMLAGTSVYMTPAHIFKNRVLMDVFGNDLSRVFYMQDWFAAIGMIYDVIKGRWLFKITSRLIPEMARARKRGQKNNIPMTDTFSNVSRIFWNTAEEELMAAIKRDQEIFQLIHLSLPEHIVDMFEQEVHREKLMLRGLIKYCVGAQTYFSKNAQKLIKATYEEVRMQRLKLERDGKDRPSSSDNQQKIIEMLKRIENLKFKLKNAEGAEEIVKKPITGETFLIFLFQRVCNAMNPF